MSLEQQIDTFRQLKNADFANAALGNAGFGQFEVRLRDVYRMLETMLRIVQTYPDLGQIYNSKIETYLTRFNGVASQTVRAPGSLGSTSVTQFTDSVKNQLNEFLDRVYGNSRGNPGPESDLRTTFTQLKLAADELDEVGYGKRLEDLKNNIEQVESVKSSLSVASAEQAAGQFSEFFGQEAIHYSSPRSKTAQYYGASQRWLILIFALVAVMSVYIGCGMGYSEDTVSRLHTRDSLRVASITTPQLKSALDEPWYDDPRLAELLRHLLVLSIIVFGVRFASKQYNVSKHLYAVNKHKANLANTFSALLGSTIGQDPSTRDTLVREIVGSLASYHSAGFIEGGDPEVTVAAELAKAAVSNVRP